MIPIGHRTALFSSMRPKARAGTKGPLLSLDNATGLDQSRVIRAFDSLRVGAAGTYKRLATSVLRMRWLVVIAAFLLLGAAIHLSRGLGNEFLPQVDDGLMEMRHVESPASRWR